MPPPGSPCPARTSSLTLPRARQRHVPPAARRTRGLGVAVTSSHRRELAGVRARPVSRRHLVPTAVRRRVGRRPAPDGLRRPGGAGVPGHRRSRRRHQHRRSPPSATPTRLSASASTAASSSRSATSRVARTRARRSCSAPVTSASLADRRPERSPTTRRRSRSTSCCETYSVMLVGEDCVDPRPTPSCVDGRRSTVVRVGGETQADDAKPIPFTRRAAGRSDAPDRADERRSQNGVDGAHDASRTQADVENGAQVGTHHAVEGARGRSRRRGSSATARRPTGTGTQLAKCESGGRWNTVDP